MKEIKKEHRKEARTEKDGRKSDIAGNVSLILNLFFSCESCVRAIPAYVPFSLWQVPVTGFNLTHEQRQRSMPWPQSGRTWNDHSDGWKSSSAQNLSWMGRWGEQLRWKRQSEEVRQ